MKQILLTLKRPEHLSQAEVKDFLAVCNHSPQWIGDESLWEIKSFQIWTKQQKGTDKTVITALLENETWKEPEVKAMTYEQVCDILQNVDKNKIVEVGGREGLNGNIFLFKYGFVSDRYFDDDTYELSFEGQNASQQITVKDLFIALDLSTFEIAAQELVGDPLSDSEFWDSIRKSEKWDSLRNKQVAVNFDIYKHECHPVTELVIEDNKVIIIYNKDIVIE